MKLKNIKMWICDVISRLIRQLKATLVKLLLRIFVRFPLLHCELLVRYSTFYGIGKIYSREFPHNIANPEYFNEKLLWLKYYVYNKSDLCAKCFDKYYVRDYVRDCGCGCILNELYGVWDNIEDIPWDSLPEEYVLKVTNGCKGHIFKRRGEKVTPEGAIYNFGKNEKRQQRVFVTTGNLFAVKMPQKYICEKLLGSEMGYESPEDYKFYCFNGEPLYLLVIMDRNGNYRETFKKIDLSDASDYSCTAENIPIEKPCCYDEMLEICRKLSAPFPFVRVDLYIQNGHPVFGELTFTPSGAFMLEHVFDKTGKINFRAITEMGNQLKLPEGSKPGTHYV